MKKLLRVFLVLTMILGFTACSSKPAEKKETTVEKTEKKKLNVYCAASMTETMEQIKKVYEEKHKDILLILQEL